ncbi:flagellar biosynthetic protein FliO [Aeromonas enteropelogenes]|uniref:flagellar biosynthetic protein FliO n=1 Tax=Aeromonas enteropelogenes TaxID=29489 RepID=UPI0005A89A61|nr:flagellar biosynthetic protein FliO [Aeromonas enteropelogenes]MBL0520254.1 flagellar biosynthetic protein FliO [Aeromonas enteropelogenes]UBH50847.1 flagellar biosynthetic protein FliO [Aeromonas enteropelogenes]
MMRLLLLLLLPLTALADVGGAANPPSLSSWLLSSLMVIGLILVLGFLLKKSKIANAMGGGQMRVIASLPVGYKEKLMVVKVGEQQLLIGVTPQQVNFLYRLEEPLDESQPQAFSQQLGKLMGKHEQN